MNFFKLIIYLSFFTTSTICSQQINLQKDTEKKSLRQIFKTFVKTHDLNFAYDAGAVKKIFLSIEEEQLSILSLQQYIESQTKYILQKLSDTDFILIRNNKTITICGVIIDANSSFELPHADIIRNQEVIDLSDKLGTFEIQVDPQDTISVSYLGYRSKKLNISELSVNHCDTIRLQPEIQNLGQVLVKEYLTGGIQKNQDAAVNVSTKKLRILPGLAEPDVLQSLQLLPGISSPTEDPAGLYIRGGTPGQNLVLWDGIKMYYSGHLFNQISTFNPFITKNVKVYRGGTSVRYGDRISGAVIIESDDDLTENIKAGGGINFTHGDAFLKIPLSKKLGIMLAGRRSTTDLYRNITYNNLVRKIFQNTRANFFENNEETVRNEQSRDDDFSFADTNFKMVWRPNDQNTIKLSTILVENRLNNNRVAVFEGSDQEAKVSDILKLRNSGFSLNWDKNYTKSIYQNANFYLSSYDQRYNFIVESDDPFVVDDTTINNAVKDIGAEYSLHFPITNRHSMHMGYQFSYNETVYDAWFNRNETDLIDDNRFIIKGNGTNHTFYSEYKYKTPKSYVNLGFRGSQLSNVNDFFVEPRIFASYELLKNFTLNTSLELKNQQLNNYLTYNSTDATFNFLPVADNVWILSNNTSSQDEEIPLIRVLKSRQFTLGGLYTHKGWNIDVEGYYKKLNDLSSLSDLILDVANPNNLDTSIFYGEEERIGIDFLLKKRIQNYRFWVGYSLSKTISSFPLVQETYFVGNYDQRHVFNFSQTWKLNKFELALGWNYATGRPFTKLIRDDSSAYGVVIDPNGINSSRFKDYHRLDASVVYRFNIGSKKNWDGLFGISIRNLYNRKNIISESFRDQQGDNFSTFLTSFQNESLRFTPDIVFRVNF